MARVKGLHSIVVRGCDSTGCQQSLLAHYASKKNALIEPSCSESYGKMLSPLTACGWLCKGSVSTGKPAIVWPMERTSFWETYRRRGSAEKCLHTAWGQQGCPLPVSGTDALPGGGNLNEMPLGITEEHAGSRTQRQHFMGCRL